MKQLYFCQAFKNIKNFTLTQLWILIGSVCLPLLASAQVNITQVSMPGYTQDFNGLNKFSTFNWRNNQQVYDPATAAVGLAGWYVQRGSVPAAVITAGNGSDSKPGLFSLGSGDYNFDNNDRSLGGISSSEENKLFYVLRLKNSTTETINKINVKFALEQWWNNPGSNDRFGLSYKTGTTNDIDNTINNAALNSSNGWTVADNKIAIPSKGRPGPKPGDTRLVSLDLNLTLAIGQEILIRFEDAVNTKTSGYNAIGIDNVVITANPGRNALAVYHYVGGNGNQKDDLTLTRNWKTNPNGSGDSPANFTDDFQLFLIDVPNKGQGQPNTQSPELPGNWTVSGNGSKVILGDGQQGFGLTIASTATFTGTIDLKGFSIFNIDNSNNFDLNLVRTPAINIDLVEENSTVNYRGNGRQYISEADYYNLNVSGSDVKYLSGSSSATAALGLNASNIYLHDFDLVVGDGASTSGEITRTSGYIITTGFGSLQRYVPGNGTALFPVGSAVNNAANGTPSYTPATLAQKGTGDILSVRVIDGYYENYTNRNQPQGDRATQDVVNRSWVVEEGIQGGSEISLTLQWAQSAHAPFFIPEASELTNFIDAAWFNVPNTVYTALSNNMHQINGNINTLGVFGLSSNNRNEPLPVALVSFKAVRVKGEVELKWQTAMERSNNFFTIEQSTDGKFFSEVAKVKGAGNSNQQKNYSHLHLNAPTQATYYRLKQTDFDGTFTYSAVVAVSGISRLGALAIYPNPGTGRYTLQGAADITEAMVVDATGRTVLKMNKTNHETGMNLNLVDQKPGVYFLRLTSPTATQTLRLIKQ